MLNANTLENRNTSLFKNNKKIRKTANYPICIHPETHTCPPAVFPLPPTQTPKPGPSIIPELSLLPKPPPSITHRGPLIPLKCLPLVLIPSWGHGHTSPHTRPVPRPLPLLHWHPCSGSQAVSHRRASAHFWFHLNVTSCWEMKSSNFSSWDVIFILRKCFHGTTTSSLKRTQGRG